MYGPPPVSKLKVDSWHSSVCVNVSGLCVKLSVLPAMMGNRAPSSL